MLSFSKQNTEIRAALQPLRGSLLPIIAVSGVINILMLAGSLFMLLVYDVVLPSRSLPTLVGLLLMVSAAYLFHGILDYARSRIMGQVGSLFDITIAPRLHGIMARYELQRGPLISGVQPVRDLDDLRRFISGPAPLAILDLPWMLVFLTVLTIFHWSLGLLTLAGVAVMVVLMIITDRKTQSRLGLMTQLSAKRYAHAQTTRRNAEVIHALGMGRTRADIWDKNAQEYITAADDLAKTGGGMSIITRGFRMFLQSAVLALGAYLVVQGSATGGIIIASSILAARALAPVEQVIAHWRSTAQAMQASQRLGNLLSEMPDADIPMNLPVPTKTLDAKNITSGPPNRHSGQNSDQNSTQQKVTIADINLSLNAGDALAIVGASGCGKSTLLRTLAGIWPALRGSVRLDGASLTQWDSDALGRTIGYIPQQIELFEGSIAQNIARFDPQARSEDIIAAARAADVHDLITGFAEGYGFRLSADGSNLSAGQRQRVALARALYGDPFLILLDEPNSNLDQEGEAALTAAIKSARNRGAIVVIVAHRKNILSHVSHVMVMQEGRVQSFGPRDAVLQQSPASSSKTTAPEVKVTEEQL